MTTGKPTIANSRNRLDESEEVRRELDKLTNLYSEVKEDNSQLEYDIEQYKDNVRSLST